MNNKKTHFNAFNKLTAWSDNLLLILAVFTCTFFIYKSFDIRMIFGYAVLGVILGIHLLRRIIFKIPVKLSPIKIAYIFFVAVILVYFCLPNANRNRDTASYIISMVICSAYLFFSQVSEKEIKMLKTVLISAAVVLSAYIVICGLAPNIYWRLIYPHLSQATQVMAAHYIPRGYGVPVGGSYTFVDYVISLALPIIVGCILVKAQSRKKAVVLIAFLYLFFIAAVLQGRRGEFIAIIATFAIVYLLTVNFKDVKQIKKRMASGVGIALSVAVLFVGLGFAGLAPRYTSTLKTIFSNVEEHFNSIPSDVEVPEDEMEEGEEVDISSGRTELWSLATDLFLEKPVTGIGWSSFAIHVPNEFNEAHANGGNTAVSHVHNTYLQFLCETGVIGTILLLTPMFYCFIQTCLQTLRLNKRRREEGTGLTIICNTAALGIQCFFLVVNVIDMAFYHYKFWGFYALGIAFTEIALNLEKYDFNDKFTSAFKRAGKKLKLIKG